jgi:hypothetical protein
MIYPKLFLSPVPLLLAASLLLSGCSQSPTPEVAAASDAVDLSGSWELDYGQSDNLQEELNRLWRDLQRQAERQDRRYQQGGAGAVSAGAVGARSGESIVAVARMADLVTQAQLLHIEQDDHNITIKREENFALTCEFYPGQLHTVETPFGREVCGWAGHQLVFRLLLPDGLTIQHRMTLGPEGRRLNIATTVMSDQVSYPFTLDRVYNRYTPESNGIRCEMTLTRGRVCTTEAQ